MKRIIVIVCFFVILFSITVVSGCHLFKEECGIRGICAGRKCSQCYDDCDCATNDYAKNNSRILTSTDYTIQSKSCIVVEEDMVFFDTHKLYMGFTVQAKCDISYCSVTITAMKDDFVVHSVTQYFSNVSAGELMTFGAEYEIRKVYGKNELDAYIEVNGEVLE